MSANSKSDAALIMRAHPAGNTVAGKKSLTNQIVFYCEFSRRGAIRSYAQLTWIILWITSISLR
jgi:hypothetical protein